MEENNEIKSEDVEVKSEEKNECCKKNSTKMLDKWLFFCFDILLLIFVLGISIFIFDMRENLRQLNEKADRIENLYEMNAGEVEDWVEVNEDNTVDTTTETVVDNEIANTTANTVANAVANATEETNTVVNE
jgi:uncharacterized protein YpmS